MGNGAPVGLTIRGLRFLEPNNNGLLFSLPSGPSEFGPRNLTLRVSLVCAALWCYRAGRGGGHVAGCGIGRPRRRLIGAGPSDAPSGRARPGANAIALGHAPPLQDVEFSNVAVNAVMTQWMGPVTVGGRPAPFAMAAKGQAVGGR